MLNRKIRREEIVFMPYLVVQTTCCDNGWVNIGNLWEKLLEWVEEDNYAK